MRTRSSAQQDSRQHTRGSTTAACEACRKMKMRCIRQGSQEHEPCDRCRRHDRPCRIPPPRPLGRKPGALGRYRGLEKAYRNVQAELKKVRGSSDDIPQSLDGLQLAIQEENVTGSELRQADQVAYMGKGSEDGVMDHGESLHTGGRFNFSTNVLGRPQTEFEPMSNPLALLADASEAAQVSDSQTHSIAFALPSNALQVPENSRLPPHVAQYSIHHNSHKSLGLSISQHTLEAGLKALLAPAPNLGRYSNYFKPLENVSLCDAAPEHDPVEMGLVTMNEVYTMFPIYFARLHPINGILDPSLHTPDFVRSRSSLLFTWILALTAQFEHRYVSMEKRLRLHGERLSRYIHKNGLKSVEIVQGYYISLLSAIPAETFAEERSWLYTMYAFGLAVELGLDQGSQEQHSDIVRSSEQVSTPVASVDVSKHSWGCWNPTGFDQSAPNDVEYSLRLARNRERTWFRILLWERANSASHGRIKSFPGTGLISNIEDWCIHPLADPADKYTCAFILLRRHLAALHNEIQKQVMLLHSSPHWVRELIDRTLEPWRLSWLRKPSSFHSQAEKLSATFLHYVYLHNRLWTLSYALNLSVNGDKGVNAIRKDCFHAAIHICEIAVRDLQETGEPLYCMLSPTWAMISYAAVLSLKLFPSLYGSKSEKEVELLALLANVALQLEQAGTTPAHRFGIAALLGQHLHMILRSKVADLKDLPISLPHCSGQPSGPLEIPSPIDISTETPITSTSDPFMAPSPMTLEGARPGDDFDLLFREIFGPSFGDIF